MLTPIPHYSGKTRLLVTNQLQYLRSCDGVIVIERGSNGSGFIRHKGTFSELMQDPHFASIVEDYGSKSSADSGGATTVADPVEVVPAESTASTPVAKAESAKVPRVKSAGVASQRNLIVKEEKAEGAVRSTVYLRYLGAAGSIALTIFLVSIANSISQVCACFPPLPFCRCVQFFFC